MPQVAEALSTDPVWIRSHFGLSYQFGKALPFGGTPFGIVKLPLRNQASQPLVAAKVVGTGCGIAIKSRETVSFGSASFLLIHSRIKDGRDDLLEYIASGKRHHEATK